MYFACNICSRLTQFSLAVNIRQRKLDGEGEVGNELITIHVFCMQYLLSLNSIQLAVNIRQRKLDDILQ